MKEVRLGAARLSLAPGTDPMKWWSMLSPEVRPQRTIRAMTQTTEGPIHRLLSAMRYGHDVCAGEHHVESALQETTGVKSAHVDLMANRASVIFDPALTHPEDLVEAIRKAGYDAAFRVPGKQIPSRNRNHLRAMPRSKPGLPWLRRCGHGAGHALGRGNGRRG